MRSRQMSKFLGAALSLSLFVFSADVCGQEIAAAVVSEVKGSVKIISQDGIARDAAVNAAVLGEEIVETEPESKAALIFDDGSRIELGPSTRLKVNDQVYTGASSVLLYIGRLFAHILPAQNEESVFTVQTLTATAGVRGTDFEAAAGMDGASLVGVDEGAVDVISEEGSITVGPGEEADVSYDGKISRLKRARRSSEEWQGWFQNRQQFFIDHSDQVLNILSRNIELSRGRIADQDKKIAALKSQIQASYQKPGISYYQARNGIKKQIPDYMKMMRSLGEADNRLAAVDYIIAKADDMAQATPAAFSPAFREKVSAQRARLKGMNVAEIHRQNRQILAAHFTGIWAAAKKYSLQQEVWRNLSPRARQQMLKKWQDQKQRPRPGTKRK